MNSQQHLSSGEIKKKTLSTSVQQPISIYPSALGILGGMYLLTFGFSVIALGLCLGGLVMGAGGWLFEYLVRGPKHALNIVNRFRESLEKKRRESISRIQDALSSLQHKDGLHQLEQLNKKFNNFEQVLAKKLNSGELTYCRYLAMGEQVYLNALDNLEQLGFCLQSVSAINMERVNDKLSRLGEASPEREPLLARAQLWHEQQQKARMMLSENENAMTQLDRVTARLAEIRIKEGRAQMDMENAIAELELLISKASQYERKS